ncbi:putative adhesin [Acinetobacter equi]|uniref:Putative adhesin Stv domain-containing protein n=1 Tax=Acinetobacter equi TaxID=1324350 RepID=A0A0N9W352_9GAMM|nr:hypothetical protein [Acinetobacter equi]ALH96217.1 hypothetical protein AOY20_12100 [Acinetobacter equi]
MTKAKKAHIYTVSGHGQQIKQRSFIVPENVYIHFWTEAGESLNDDLASRIERNPVLYLDQAIYTVRPGEFCPEHVLYDLDGLAKGYSWQNNVTEIVTHHTKNDALKNQKCIRLSSIISTLRLTPQEPIHMYWLACRNYVALSHINDSCIEDKNTIKHFSMTAYEVYEPTILGRIRTFLSRKF